MQCQCSINHARCHKTIWRLDQKLNTLKPDTAPHLNILNSHMIPALKPAMRGTQHPTQRHRQEHSTVKQHQPWGLLLVDKLLVFMNTSNTLWKAPVDPQGCPRFGHRWLPYSSIPGKFISRDFSAPILALFERNNLYCRLHYQQSAEGFSNCLRNPHWAPDLFRIPGGQVVELRAMWYTSGASIILPDDAS